MNKELSLLLDLYELTMGQGYYNYRRDTRASFDLFVRGLPKNRSYLVACGLEDILDYVKNLRFSETDIRYLKSQNLFTPEFLNYLKKFRFTGDIWAMPEGTVFFPDEPVVRITANISEAQILESYLLNTINLPSMIASKASRIVTQGQGKQLFDFSLRRNHGAQASLMVTRSSYIAGFDGTSNVLAAKLFGIKPSGTMAHSFIMSFKEEIDSFLAYANTFPDKTILLVDTYNTKKGIANALTMGLYMKEKRNKLFGIRLDSGDIAYWSKYARQELDRAGLNFVKIFATGNLDEFKIKALLEKEAPVDSFGVGTNMGASIDAPSLDVIYKLCEVTDEEGEFQPVMKLSKAKRTLPGRKQVFRLRDKNGKYRGDIIALEKERIKGKALLVKVVSNGKIIYRNPTLDKIRSRLKYQLSNFPKQLLAIDASYRYPLKLSPQLNRLKNKLSRRLEKRQ